MLGSTTEAVPDSFKARLSVRLAWLLGYLLHWLPRSWAYWLADRAGGVVYRLFPTYRGNVRANLAPVLGRTTADDELDRVVRRVFQTSARNFVDLLGMPFVPAHQLRERVHAAPSVWAELDGVLASGRGAILATAHLGAFDIVAQVLAISGYAVTALTARTVPEFIHVAVNYLRSCRGLTLEPATPGGVRRAIRALERGEVVGIAADRDFFHSGLPVAFFGRQTTLPPGPVRIARQAQVPLIPAFAVRRADGYELRFDAPIHVPRTEDAEADLRVGLERLAAVFERYISQNADQWVMFQRVWPMQPAPALRVFPVGSPLEGELLGRGADRARPLTAAPDAPTDHMDSPPSPSPAATRRPATPQE